MTPLARTFLIVLPALAAACSAPPASAPPTAPAIPVSLTTAEMREVPRTFESGGVVHARVTASIASRITSTVERVAVVAGQRVRAGDTLIALDARELLANQQRAAAEIAALERTKAASESDQAAAQAAQALAHNNFARTEILRRRDSATGQESDEATAALMAAEARVDAAGARVAAAAASLEAARQAASAADVAATYAVITAPFDGIVTERHVDPGNLATAGTPLLQIDQIGGYRLETDVDESRVASIRTGDPVDIVFSAGDDGPTLEHGSVGEIARAIDAGSHTFRIKIDLPRTAAVRSGQFARARFTSGTRAVLTIAPGALVPQGDLSTVFIVTPDNHARMRIVSTGEADPSWVEVLAGLTAGDQVVLNPNGIHDGSSVRTMAMESRR